MSIALILGAESPAMAYVQILLNKLKIPWTYATGDGVFRVSPGKRGIGWYDPESGSVCTDVSEGLVSVGIDGPWGEATIPDDGTGENFIAASLIGKVIYFLAMSQLMSDDWRVIIREAKAVGLWAVLPKVVINAAVEEAIARLEAAFFVEDFNCPSYDNREALKERLMEVAGRMGLIECEEDVSCVWDEGSDKLVQLQKDRQLGHVIVTLDGTLAWYLPLK